MGPILSLKNIVKIYPNGVVANKGINIDIEENTIHAIVGENGAGKSTLMKIIFGEETAEEGEIFYQGEQVHFRNSLEAIDRGIGMIHQHLMLAPELTVAENMILGTEPIKFGIFLHSKKILEMTEKACKEFGFEVPLDKRVKDLPVGTRQRIEILKVLIRNAKLIILDEPTAVLTPQETEVLFKSLRALQKRGKTIIFISHKLKEVKQIADRVTIIRDGKDIATEDAEDLNEHQIAELMVGREINFQRIPQPVNIGVPFLKVQNLTYVNEENITKINNISFEVRKGEIVCIAGVEGNGQTELVEILTGLRQATSGHAYVNNEDITHLTPRQIREKMVAHIPEDRMQNGVAENASIQENIIVDRYYKRPFSKGMILDWKYIENYTTDLIKDFNILAQSGKTSVSALSGGNIQKVVVARELSFKPELIIADQPTRGIDVGSEEMVHDLLKDARDKGIAVFLISADLDEVLKIASRILVMYNGEIAAEFTNTKDITQEKLGPYMLGVKNQNKASVEES
ncbi:MAG: ABC transporter ATP-binding protein [Spirochaetales bacterium]|nr:ABC transporter ATP-binding protein [Spirochaetales bacterium]